jgi:hypothetical protein
MLGYAEIAGVESGSVDFGTRFTSEIKAASKNAFTRTCSENAESVHMQSPGK